MFSSSMFRIQTLGKTLFSEFSKWKMANRDEFRRKSGNCNKPLRQDQRRQQRLRNFSTEDARGGRGRQNSEGYTRNEGAYSGRSSADSDRPPPGLRGKAIGLWYRDRNKAKNEQRNDDDSNNLEVFLDINKREQIEDLISSVGAARVKEEEGENFMSEGAFKTSYLKKITMTFEENVEKLREQQVIQDSQIDHVLYNNLTREKKSVRYQEMCTFREKLPAFKQREEIVRLIEQNQVVVISGETGCGKTTQCAQFVLDDYIMKMKGSMCNIVCTQPRRISAITVAERVAAERDESIGDTVGYQIRLEKVSPKRKKGSLVFVTTGIVLQWMQTNPALNEITHLFLDEIHERDVMCDFVITFLKIILHKRPNLKVVLMSATLNADHFSAYFGGVPCIHIPGFTYPVEELYLENILELVNFRFSDEKRRFHRGRPRDGKDKDAAALFSNYVVPHIRDLETHGVIKRNIASQLVMPESENLNIDLMEAIVQHICMKERDGAILVFVPGLMQIQNLHKQLNNNRYFSPARHLIIPLHSIMPTTNQRKVFDRPPKGVRKIIIATSIAESSITIDDVVFVVDSGRNKMQTFDMEMNVSTLVPEWESLANARQKRGRAGRVQPGKCFKLFTKAREEIFEPYPLPEMQRTKLEEVVLQAKMLQLGRVAPFLEKVMDPPDPKAVQLALEMLRTLNALDSDEKLTPLGYHLAKLPMDPRTGKMVLMGALFSCVQPIFAIAGSLNFKDPFTVPLGKEREVDRVKERFSRGERSDHYVISEAIRAWEEADRRGNAHDFAWENFMSSHTCKLLSNMKRQFAEHLYNMNFLSSPDPEDLRSNVNSHNVALVKSIICSGLYPNVAMIKAIKRRPPRCQILLKTMEHPRVDLHPKSLCEKQARFESPFLVYHMMLKSTAIYLHDATMVYPMALLFFGERLDIIEVDGGGSCIRVDKMIKFKCFKKTALLVKKLRNHLDWILEAAISNPEAIDWATDEPKTRVLKAIVELITTEDERLGVEARDD